MSPAHQILLRNARNYLEACQETVDTIQEATDTTPQEASELAEMHDIIESALMATIRLLPRKTRREPPHDHR